MIDCRAFQAGLCRSCSWLDLEYDEQIARKNALMQDQLKAFISDQTAVISAQISPQLAFRNKAKMAVAGSVERPILGVIPDPKHPEKAVDLSDCLLYPAAFNPLFQAIKRFIGRAGLVPYHTVSQRGELKFVLITQSQATQQFLVRFVLKSTKKIALMQRELADFLAHAPKVAVVSANIQPKHAAVLEGEEEIFLTPTQFLAENFNKIPLFLRAGGFFQTNPSVAKRLYATAADWIEHLPIQRIWDLFCGVGGFGLHCAKALQVRGRKVELCGIEISESAIACAKQSAMQLGLENVDFQALDVNQHALSERPDLLIVNPPRRGVGKLFSTILLNFQPHFVLYSSCNITSMASDLAQIDGYQLTKVQVFDMFPHTEHFEVLGLLEKRVV